MYGLYGAILRLAWAVVLPYQIVTARLAGRHGPPWRERLALRPHPDQVRHGGIWVHAVSVGEVRLAFLVIAAARRRWPGLPIHLTTCTPTGRTLAEGARRTGGAGAPDTVSDLPIDLPGPVGRFLDRLQPRALFLMETELWPNLLRLAGARGVAIAVLNGRISPRAFPRYRRARTLFARALPAVRLFAMQSAEDARRITALGAPGAAVFVSGNMKFDLPVPVADGVTARRRLGFADDGTILVAGSTARGEEEATAGAFLALRRVDPAARLVVAPRHPEDVEAMAAALAAAGINAVRWSALPAGGGAWPGGRPRPGEGTEPPPGAEAVLVDVLGVLPEVYAAATLAFVGGSLVPRGGQNLLEPAALGRPVLFGPHVENWRAAAEALLLAGGAVAVRDAADLAAKVVRLAGDPREMAETGARARAVVEANRGALDRTLELIAVRLGLPAGAVA
jgi:3-deoxy-D-manno-octulosonic-acid transferase